MKLIERTIKIEECRRIIKAFNINVSMGSHGEANLSDVMEVIRELYVDGYNLETIAYALEITLAEVLQCVGIPRPKDLEPEQFFGVSSVYENVDGTDLVLIAEEQAYGLEGYSNFYIYEHSKTKDNYVVIEVYNEVGYNLVDLDMVLYSKASDNSTKDTATCYPLVIDELPTKDGLVKLYPELKPIIEEILKYTGISLEG